MTLKEKIAESFALGEKILAENKNVTSIWFELENIPVKEVEEYGIPADVDITRRGGKDVVRLYVNNHAGITIFVYSNPVKKIAATYLAEEAETIS